MKALNLLAIVFSVAMISISWTSLDTEPVKNSDDCLPIISVTFNGSCISVTSDKELSNVVIGCVDVSGPADSPANYYEIKFDDLSGYTGEFCCPNGGTIITAWVKSGCNSSGDGSGYGERFDVPTTGD